MATRRNVGQRGRSSSSYLQNLGRATFSASGRPIVAGSGGGQGGGSVTSTASQAVGKWRTMTGYHNTATTGTFPVIVEAYPTRPAIEGDFVSCTFYVTVTSDSTQVFEYVYTSRTLTQPNWSAAASPLPGVSSDMAPVWGYAHTINWATIGSGTINVTATLRTQSGYELEMEEIVLYNDADQTDRRPSTKQIYVNPTGDDANPGTIGSPVKTIHKAVQLCRSGGSSATITDADCGGAEIVLQSGAHDWAGGAYGMPDWHTSQHWWLTITFESGATARRVMAGVGQTTYPDSYLIAPGFQGLGYCNIRLQDPVFVGEGAVINCSSNRARYKIWVDGGESRSQHWGASEPWSTRFVEDTTQPVTVDGAGAVYARRFASCHLRKGCTFGFAGWTWLQDCHVKDYLGVAIQSTGNETCDGTNILIERQRYTSSDVEGYVDVTGGADLDVTIPGAGQMRIDATSSVGVDFAARLAGLVGSDYVGCKTSGFPSAGNNGTFEVLSTGTNGSALPYVILDNASAVVETGTASARLEVAIITSQQLYTMAVHPDTLMYNDDRKLSLYSAVACRDIESSQGSFTNGRTLTRCVQINTSSGGQDLVNNFNQSTFNACLFAFNTFVGAWDFGGNQNNGSTFWNNVMDRANSFPGGAGTSHNHFVTSGTTGANSSTGAWFANNTTVTPWDLTPTVGNMDTALTTIPMPPAWEHSGSTTTSRGCLANIATIDWS